MNSSSISCVLCDTGAMLPQLAPTCAVMIVPNLPLVNAAIGLLAACLILVVEICILALALAMAALLALTEAHAFFWKRFLEASRYHTGRRNRWGRRHGFYMKYLGKRVLLESRKAWIEKWEKAGLDSLHQSVADALKALMGRDDVKDFCSDSLQYRVRKCYDGGMSIVGVGVGVEVGVGEVMEVPVAVAEVEIDAAEAKKVPVI